ncbi:MAG: hypothetical protein ACXU8N_01045 [Telluria sp.]
MLRIAMQTLWPAFLMAIVAEGAFFSLFDVADLLALAGLPHLPPIAGYTIGFFFFWTWISLGALLSYYLMKVPRDPHPPF